MGVFSDWFKSQTEADGRLRAYEQATSQYQLDQLRANMSGGGVGNIYAVDTSTLSNAVSAQSKPLEITPTYHFITEKVENGYMVYCDGKKYYAEDKVALGNQIVVLLTTFEVRDGD